MIQITDEKEEGAGMEARHRKVKKQESLDSGQLLLILYRKTENTSVQIEHRSMQHLNFDQLFKDAKQQAY